MSIISKKNNISNSISIISSLSGVLNANTLDTNTTIFNNKSKNSTFFILNLLTSIVGSEILKDVLSGVLNKSIPNIEPIIKESLKNTIYPLNSDDIISNDIFVNGVDIPLTQLDYGKRFKVKENDASLIMDISNNSLDFKIYRSIITKQTQETNDIFISYKQDTDSINIRPKQRDKNGKIISDMINNTTFFNKKLIVTFVLDMLFGTLLSLIKKSNKQINDDESINKILSKLLDDPDNDNFFILSPNELEDINNRTFSKLNNTLPLDYDCGVLNSGIDIQTLDDILNSDNIVDEIDKSFNGLTPSNPDPQKIDSISNDKINSVNDLIKNNNRFNNKSALKDGLYKNFINIVSMVIIKETLLSPKALIIILLAKKMSNNNSSLGNGIDIISNQKNIIKCLVKIIISEFNKFLFGFLKKEILKITKPYAVAILNEKLNNYSNILRSLVRL